MSAVFWGKRSEHGHCLVRTLHIRLSLLARDLLLGGRGGPDLRHFLQSDLVGDPCALDERVSVIAQFVAQLIDLLMFIENLQLLEVEVALFVLQSLSGLFLHQPLPFFLNLDLLKALLLGLSQLATHLGFLLADLACKLDVVFPTLFGAHLRHLLLRVVVFCGFRRLLALLFLVFFQRFLALGDAFKQYRFSLHLETFLILSVLADLVLNLAELGLDALACAHTQHLCLYFVL